MINKDRIVPVERIDLISLYATIISLTRIDGALEILKAETVDGQYSMTEQSSAAVLCDQPVLSFDFGSEVTGAGVYFVADYGFKGFTVDGVAVPTEGDTVVPDGVTLYMAMLQEGVITIHNVMGGGDDAELIDDGGHSIPSAEPINPSSGGKTDGSGQSENP